MFMMIWKKKTIIQYQIPDFFGNKNIIFIDMADSSHRYYHEKLFGNLGIRKRKKQVKTILFHKNQTTLSQFFPQEAGNESRRFKLPYRQKIDFPPIPSQFQDSLEFMAVQHDSSALGYLKHLFQLNTLDFWDTLPLNSIQKKLYRTLSMADVFKLEIARYKRGIKTFEEWIDDLEHVPGLIDAVQIYPRDIPSPNQYGQLVHHLGSNNIKNYFLELVAECMRYKLIDCKIIIWDGRFLESNCSKNKNKKLKAFSDHEAGKYKHVGKYKGVGYVDSSFICAKSDLPIYYESYPANRNDNITFRGTFNNYMMLGFPASTILIADAGPYSNESLDLVYSHGIIPLIFARKNIKKNVIKVATRKYINLLRVPPEMIQHLSRLLDMRTKVEREFSLAKVVYHVDRMNNRGIENSRMCIGKLKCIELLTALTALKIHRLDLIKKPTAFKAYRPEFSVMALEEKLSNVNSYHFNRLNPEFFAEKPI